VCRTLVGLVVVVEEKEGGGHEEVEVEEGSRL